MPKLISRFDDRGVIRISLGTRDEAEAIIKARAHDESLEHLWAALVKGLDARGAWAAYEAAVNLAKVMGYRFRSIPELAEGPVEDLIDRAIVARDHIAEPLVREAILVGAEKPKPKISDLWDIYSRHAAVDLAGMSPNQLYKHKRRRDRVVETMIEVLTDKVLEDITRDDMLKYRDFWQDRVLSGEITVDTANRHFSDLKGLLSTADEALNTTHSSLSKSITIRKRGAEKRRKRTRPPYPTQFVVDFLMEYSRLDGLNTDGRLILYTMIETGMRLSEVCNLRPQDIRLDEPIPYVTIEERDDRDQKTVYSIRTIPLVGISLWALQQAPQGFPRYIDKGDTASATINKFLTEHKLRPTPKHSLYSLRHTFQDRILAAGAPDRLQTDLMGHEFERESYGEGSSMEQKLELLNRIKFPWNPPPAELAAPDAMAAN